jgi:hypothetical protein
VEQGKGLPAGRPHGGGSCQFSLSYDNGVTFNVIHSVVGGWPLNDTMNTYKVKIPDNAPGAMRVLFAWTWFNRQGLRYTPLSFEGLTLHREMYMNCALVNIYNPNLYRDVLNTPEIFTANIGLYGMGQTIEGSDVRFPDPGISADYTLGDRNLSDPIFSRSGRVLFPEPAPEVGTDLQTSTTKPSPSSLSSSATENCNVIQPGLLLLIFVGTSILNIFSLY